MLFDRVKPLATILAEGSDTEHGLKRSLDYFRAHLTEYI